MIRHALRSLLQSPGTTVPIVMTLAVAIALVTTLFSLVNGYAWRALPYEEAERVVAVGVQLPRYGGMGYVERADVEHVRALPELGGVATYRMADATVRYGETAVRDRILYADRALFEVLRTGPAAGRLYAAGEVGAAILSHGGWQSRFGGSDAAVGTVVHVDGQPHTIVGVLPERFSFRDAALYVPFGDQDAGNVLARLTDGASADVAKARLESMTLAGVAYGAGARLTLDPDMVQRDPLTQAGLFLLLFLAATSFVVLIACGNVVALLLARSVARRQEFAVRAALGAGRQRLLAASVTEAALLTMTAAVLGLLLSAWLIDVLVATVPANLPGWMAFGIDWRVLAFAAGVALLCTAAVGWLPAREASNPELQLVLKTGGAAGVSARRARFGRIMVATELALAVSLFSSTVLLARSAAKLTDVDLGYDLHEVVALDLTTSASSFAHETDDYMRRLVQRLESVPAVQRVSWRGGLAGFRADGDTTRASRRPVIRNAAGDVVRNIDVSVTGGDHAATLGLRTLSGRGFTSADHVGAPAVAVLTQEAARRIAGAGDVVGRTFTIDTIMPVSVTIIGVVEDPRALRQSMSAGLDAVAQAIVFLPESQAHAGRVTAYVRADAASALIGPIATAARGVDADVAIEDVQTLHERDVVRPEVTVFGTVMGVIAAVALALAMIGLYGVVAYTTERRTREIGVRVALGAAPRQIAREVATDAGRTVVAGLAAGCLLAVAMGQLVRMMLHEVSALDPVTYLLVAICFSAVAALAVFMPGRRALRVDPMVALRAE